MRLLNTLFCLKKIKKCLAWSCRSALSFLTQMNAKGLLRLCHILMSANDWQFLHSLTNIWKSTVWKCISNVSSKFLLPDLKIKQLQWHQLQKNKTNRSYHSPRLVMIAAPLPHHSSAAVCCQSGKYKPWHFSSLPYSGWLLSTSR